MREFLEERARELAARRPATGTDRKLPILMAEWREQKWGFSVKDFRYLLEATTVPCPLGVTFKDLPCSSLLYFQSQVYPVVQWSRLVGLESSAKVSYAVAPPLGLALELSANCSIVKLDTESLAECDKPYCSGRVDDLFLADLKGVR